VGGDDPANVCGVSKKKTVLLNINRIYTNCTIGGTAMLLLFVRNLITTQLTSGYPVIVRNTLKNIEYYYSTPSSVMRTLDLPSSFRTSNIRARYIETGKLIRMRWRLFL